MVTESDLRAAISRGRFSGVYLLVGNDQYLTKRYAEKIAKKAVPENEELNFFPLTNEVSAQEIYDNLFQFSFTGEKICVSVSNFDFETCPIAEFKQLCTLVEDAPEQNVLVLYYDVLGINTKKSDRFKKLAKAVEKGKGTVCELNHKSESELIKMLCDGAAKRRTILSATVARYMISVCSNDLNILINELEKLSAYVGKDGTVTTEIVDKVCVKTLEASVYDMSRHILAGRGEQAFFLLDKLLRQSVSPAEIHSLIASAYVDIFRVKSALEKGLKAESIAAEFGYSPARSFVLNNAARDGKYLTAKQVGDILKAILDCDAKVKSEGKQTGGSAKIALECLITEIIHISRGSR